MQIDKSHTHRHPKCLSAARVVSSFAAILFLVCTARSAEWVGSADTNVENGNNWKDKPRGNVMVDPPHLGRKNPTRLSVANGSGFPLCLTGANGPTEFNEELLVGASYGPTGELKVTGGTLIVHQKHAAIVGQTVDGKMEVQGGTVNLLGGSVDTSIPGCETNWSLYLGNEPKGHGFLTVNGGQLSIENAMQIGRNGGSGILEISGNGRVICGGPILFPGGDAAKCINLGPGNGTFEQNPQGEILFLGEQGWFNFKRGSHGKLSFSGRNKAYFDQLVVEGRIRIDGQVTTPEHFVFTEEGGQGEYQLGP